VVNPLAEVYFALQASEPKSRAGLEWPDKESARHDNGNKDITLARLTPRFGRSSTGRTSLWMFCAKWLSSPHN